MKGKNTNLKIKDLILIVIKDNCINVDEINDYCHHNNFNTYYLLTIYNILIKLLILMLTINKNKYNTINSIKFFSYN
jgi:hypothetical protein